MKERGTGSAARSFAAIFATPIALALVSGIGLMAALLSNGPIDVLWSLAVAVPLFAIVRSISNGR